MDQRLLKNLPNLITVLRLALIVPVILSFYFHQYVLAFWLFFVAAASDAIDGYLARYYHTESRFGSIADPIADKLLMVSTYLVLTIQSIIPLWLLMLVFVRDIIIVSGAYVIHKRYGEYKITPTYLSKLNTLMQSLYVVALILQLAYLLFNPQWITILMYLVGLTTSLSGIHYVFLWIRKVQQFHKE